MHMKDDFNLGGNSTFSNIDYNVLVHKLSL
jgi:hypothetical protein